MKLQEARQLLLGAACIILEYGDADSISAAIEDIEKAQELLDARLGELIRKGEEHERDEMEDHDNSGE